VPGYNLKLTLALLFAPLAFGQAPADPMQDRVLYFSHVITPQGVQETVNAIRGITDIRQVTIDPGQRFLSVRGTADQIAAAAWLVGALDQSESAQPPTGSPLAYDYLGAPRGGTAVRVFWLANISTPGGIQELVNAVRGTADMSWIFSRKAPAAIIFRATPDQAALAEWLINEIDGATGAASAAPAIRKAAAYTYASDTRGDTAVRVYYLPPTVAPQSLQEIADLVRKTAHIQRFFPFNQLNAMVLRTTPEQADAAGRLIQQGDSH